MSSSCCCTCSAPAISLFPIGNSSVSRISRSIRLNRLCKNTTTSRGGVRVCGVRASAVESYDNSAKRMELAWLISKQPRPVSCSSCDSNGHVDCKWCGGTGFFIIGDNMLCQVPSRNTSCVICAGKGSTRCSDCKGTGFRAKWLEEPPVPK